MNALRQVVAIAALVVAVALGAKLWWNGLGPTMDMVDAGDLGALIELGVLGLALLAVVEGVRHER